MEREETLETEKRRREKNRKTQKRERIVKIKTN